MKEQNKKKKMKKIPTTPNKINIYYTVHTKQYSIQYFAFVFAHNKFCSSYYECISNR